MARLPFPAGSQGPLRDLLRQLHELHARAGWPSTRALAAGQSFSHVTVHDLFTKADQVPRLPTLLAVAELLAGAAPNTDVEATLDDFDRMWRECVGDVAINDFRRDLRRGANDTVAFSREATAHDAPILPGESIDSNSTATEDEIRTAAALIDRLSRRELEILTYAANGMKPRQISAATYVSMATVMRHLMTIRNKLGVVATADLRAALELHAERG